VSFAPAGGAPPAEEDPQPIQDIIWFK